MVLEVTAYSSPLALSPPVKAGVSVWGHGTPAPGVLAQWASVFTATSLLDASPLMSSPSVLPELRLRGLAGTASSGQAPPLFPSLHSIRFGPVSLSTPRSSERVSGTQLR